MFQSAKVRFFYLKSNAFPPFLTLLTVYADNMIHVNMFPKRFWFKQTAMNDDLP